MLGKKPLIVSPKMCLTENINTAQIHRRERILNYMIHIYLKNVAYVLMIMKIIVIIIY